MLRISGDVRTTHNENGAIVLDIQRGRMFTLNRAAARILRLLEAGAGEKEIARRLESETSADAETSASYVSEFVQLLRHYELLEPESA